MFMAVALYGGEQKKDLALSDCGEGERESRGRKITGLSWQEKNGEKERKEFSLHTFPNRNTTEEASDIVV